MSTTKAPETVLAEVERLSELERTNQEEYLDLLYGDQIHTGYLCVDKPWHKYFTREQMRLELPKMTVLEYIKSHPDWTNGRTAIDYYGHTISYEKMFEHIDSAIKVLYDMGVRKGDRILAMVPNVPEAIYLFYAAAELGAVMDYVDPRPDSPDLLVAARKMLSLYRDEKCKFVVSMDQCYLAMISPNEQEWKEAGLEGVLLFTAADSMTLKSKLNYAKLDKELHGKEAFDAKMEQNKKLSKAFEDRKKTSILDLRMFWDEVKRCKKVQPELPGYEPDTMVAMTHTSGTTGRPKPLPFTHDNLNAYAAEGLKAELPIHPGSRFMHAMPFFAIYGLANVLHAGFTAGVVMVEVPELTPQDFGKLVYLHKVAFSCGIPAWATGMAEDPYLQDKDLSFVDWLSVGGTGMSESEENRVNNFLADHGSKAKIVKGYGLSETCGCAGQAYADYNRVCSVGVPLLYSTFALVDPETKEMLRFEEGDEELYGELIISTPCNSSGVVDDNAYITFGTYFGKTYLMTGDVAYIDRDGMMHFEARNDRGFARFDGFNVRPGKLEEVIESIPNVKTCVITPFYDEEKAGKMVKANLVLDPGVELSTEERVELVRTIVNRGFIQNEDLSARQIPAKFKFWDALPMTAAGKINYQVLNETPITGEEVTVVVDETNVSLGNITVLAPEKA